MPIKVAALDKNKPVRNPICIACSSHSCQTVKCWTNLWQIMVIVSLAVWLAACYFVHLGIEYCPAFDSRTVQLSSGLGRYLSDNKMMIMIVYCATALQLIFQLVHQIINSYICTPNIFAKVFENSNKSYRSPYSTYGILLFLYCL